MKVDDYLLSPLDVQLPSGFKVDGLGEFQSSMKDHIKTILKQKDRDKAIMEALLHREAQALSLLNHVFKAAADVPATRQVKVVKEQIVERDASGAIARVLQVVDA